MTCSIRPLSPNDVDLFQEHFTRHRAESGRGEQHFLPFAPDDEEGPVGLNVAALDLPLDETGWQRWFVAVNDQAEIVGHVDLKGDGLKVGHHRCELGIGIEGPYRGSGLGRRLMQIAIEFARGVEALTWIDLRVFGHNAAGRALYLDMGFSEVGILIDRFRIEEQKIDDVIMTLEIGND